MPLKQRKAQIAVELEAVEGTAETLVAADATMRVYEPSFSPSVELFKRDPARAYLGQLSGIVGKQTGTITWKTELKGSGALATQPAWRDTLVACGFTGYAVSAISGAGGGGTFIPMETITGSSSGATGRVVAEWAASGGVVKYVPTSGATVFNTDDVITGGTSGASISASAAAIGAQGFEYIHDSTTPKAATTGFYMDGKRYVLAGSRGNVKVMATTGEPAFLEFSMEGVLDSVTDSALLSPTYESTVPPAFLSATFAMQSYSAVFSALSIDMQNTLAQRESANAAKGVLSVLVTDWAPQMTINPEDTLEASAGFMTKLIAATTGRAYFKVGSASANTIYVAAPKVQYADVQGSDRAGLAVADLTVDLLTSETTIGDDEIQIAML